MRAGDSSLHREWIAAPQRDFDLFISYFGELAGRYGAEADRYESRPGAKWPAIDALLREQPQLLEAYDVFWFPDDDLSASTATIDRMLAFFRAFDLSLAQPALTEDSYFTWSTLRQRPGRYLRYTAFVEVMAPIFSRAALRVCAPSFCESRSGWGLDWVWPTLCRRAGLGRMAVIDATPVRHTRPVGGELYAPHPDLDPRADAARVMRRHGLREVRAVAKYSIESEVREMALPAAMRLIHWLKRLNGRRKHRRA